MMHIAPDHLVLRRPHFHVRDAKLFFMISLRPFADLQDHDLVLWEAIDGKTTVGQLEARIPDARARVQRLWSLGACELAEPHFPAQRRRVLVIEPHMDDAVLSVGGVMWQRRHACQFTLLTVAAISNFTSYCRINRAYFDVAEVTSVRRAESQLVVRLLGGEHHMLDLRDSPQRYKSGNWSLDWYAKNRRALSAYQNRSPHECEVQHWANAIAHALATIQPDELWVPMGIGSSVDHQTTRNACLRAIVQLSVPLDQTPVYLYQDVPYACAFPSHSRQILTALSSRGGVLQPIRHDIRTAMPAKLRLISVYGSQFKMSYMQPRVERCARATSDQQNGLGEMMFRVVRLPEPLNEMSLYSGRTSVEKTRSRLQKWYPRHRTARRIRILCPMGVGQWKKYMTCLLDAFPEAKFEVHKSTDSLDETRELYSDRVLVHGVRSTPLGWLLRLVRLRFCRPYPTIILTHAKLENLATILEIAHAGCRPLTCTTLDHLVLGLRSLPSSPMRPRAASSDATEPCALPEYSSD